MKVKYGIISVCVIILIIGAIGIAVRSVHKKNNSTPPPLSNQQESIDELRQAVQVVTAEDSDLDGLSNEEEKKIGTDANNPDTDGDGLLDATEVQRYHSSPLKVDSNGDGESDGAAVSKNKNPVGGTLPGPIIRMRTSTP